MRLTALHPKWFDVPGVGTNRDGVTFLCPCAKCQSSGNPVRLGVQFSPSIEGHLTEPMSNKEKLRHVHELRTFDVPPGIIWQRTGETFDDLTLTPSIDASPSGHWHGYVSNGEVT